MDIEIDTDMY